MQALRHQRQQIESTQFREAGGEHGCQSSSKPFQAVLDLFVIGAEPQYAAETFIECRERGAVAVRDPPHRH